MWILKKNNKCTYLLQWQRWINPNPSLDTEESDSCPGIRVLHLWILFCSCRCWFRLTGPLLKVSKIFHILPARSCTSGLHPFLCLKFLMKVGTGWAETHRDHVSLTAESFSVVPGLYPAAGKDWRGPLITDCFTARNSLAITVFMNFH